MFQQGVVVNRLDGRLFSCLFASVMLEEKLLLSPHDVPLRKGRTHSSLTLAVVWCYHRGAGC